MLPLARPALAPPPLHIARVLNVVAPIDTLVKHRMSLLQEVNPKDRLLESEYRTWLERGARRDDCVHWLATQSGRVVGSLSLTRWSWAPSTHPGATGAFIYGLYVDPRYRRRGIALQLLAAVRDWALGEQIEHLTLLESPIAGDLYQRAGFLPVKRSLLAQFLAIGSWLWWSKRLVYLPLHAH